MNIVLDDVQRGMMVMVRCFFAISKKRFMNNFIGGRKENWFCTLESCFSFLEFFFDNRNECLRKSSNEFSYPFQVRKVREDLTYPFMRLEY